MTGGPLTSSIVVDLHRHLHGIKHVGSRFFTALPGTDFSAIETTLAKRGLMFPAYPASKSIATIGGMVANNAGGEKTLKYGKTERYVRSLKAVLSDGQEYEFRRLPLVEALRKSRQQNLEGQIYRTLVPLFQKHWSLIKAARPKVTKNSTGYSLWNTYDPVTKTVDFSQLLVGSQGTLGIISQVSLGVVPLERHSEMLVLYLDALERVSDVVTMLRQWTPSSLELFDDKTLKLALRFAPQLARLISRDQSLLTLAGQFVADAHVMLVHGFPKLVLMAEFSGQRQEEVDHRTTEAQQGMERLGVPVVRAHSSKESERYWVIRRQSFNLLRKHVKNVQTVPFIDDVVVPPNQLGGYLVKLRQLLGEYPQLQFSIAGHAGDGNLHIFPLMDMSDEKLRDLIPVIADRVYALTLQFGGSLSGEHNDGLIRGPYLESMYGREMYRLFKTVKATFDPLTIFNPHKKTDATLVYSNKHLKTDNEHSV